MHKHIVEILQDAHVYTHTYQSGPGAHGGGKQEPRIVAVRNACPKDVYHCTATLYDGVSNNSLSLIPLTTCHLRPSVTPLYALQFPYSPLQSHPSMSPEARVSKLSSIHRRAFTERGCERCEQWRSPHTRVSHV